MVRFQRMRRRRRLIMTHRTKNTVINFIYRVVITAFVFLAFAAIVFTVKS